MIFNNRNKIKRYCRHCGELVETNVRVNSLTGDILETCIYCGLDDIEWRTDLYYNTGSWLARERIEGSE